MALICGLQYLSSEDYHRVHRKLELKVRVAPDGSLEVDGSVDANYLPTDMEAASGVYLRMVEEAEQKISWLGPSRPAPSRKAV